MASANHESRERGRPARAAILALILALGPLAAAQAQADEDELTETIVVTASRIPVPAKQAGASLTVLDEDYIDARQALTVEQLLRGTPGMSVSRSGVLGSLSQIRLRGSEANHALVLMDGIEISDPALGGELDFSHYLAAGVRRVEVVRGPLSALWGSGAVAGAVNLISAPEAFGESVTSYAEAGQFKTRRAGISASAGVAGWGVMLAAHHLGSDGQNISRAGDEADGYRNNTGHFAARFGASDRLTLRLTARRSSSENQYDEISYATGLPRDSAHGTRRAHDVAGLRGRSSLLDGRLVQEAGITRASSENHNLTPGEDTSHNRGRKLRVSYQATYAPSASASVRASVTLGLGHERQDYVQRVEGLYFIAIYGDPNRDLSTRSSEALAEFRLDTPGSWSAAAALRYDRNRHFGNALTWRASALRRLGAGVTLRGAYGVGVKNPTFIERFGYFSNFLGNPDLLPEESRGWELGADFAGGAIGGSLTWFSERLRDEINGFVYDPVSGGFTSANRPGISRRRGLELEGRWTAFSGLTVRGAYTWLRAREPDAAGAELYELRRPRHSGSLNLHYELAGRGLAFNLNLDYTGEQHDMFFPPWPNPSRRVSLDPFLVAGLTAFWQATPRVRWHIRADNLGQARYEEVYGFGAPGRSIHLGVEFSLLADTDRR